MQAPATSPYAVGQPFAREWLPVAGGHRLYVAQYGSPAGISAIVLHGGPGSGCSPALAGFFDPRRYRVILLDQRGAGQSQPAGSRENNQAADLVGDLEALRHHLGIERWLAVGGSWGATLGILYAAAYPAALSGLLLRNPFLARRADLDWFFSGARAPHPVAWQIWRAAGAPAEPEGLLPWLVEQFDDDGEAVPAAVIAAWQNWENALAGSPARPLAAADLPRLAERYRLQLHYFQRDFFLAENAVLDAATLLAGADFPLHVLQGTADDVCPASATDLLRQRMPNCTRADIGGVGHDPFAPAMLAATISALDAFAVRGRFA
ncbi:MAG: alpha/beta fold hydrolase [Bacteroidota bacterium]